LLGVVTLLLALAVSGSATDALRARDIEIRAALPPRGVPAAPDAKVRLQGIFTRAVDVKGMVVSAMGTRWKDLPAQKQKRLLAAFEKRLRLAGVENLEEYGSTVIEYRPEVSSPDGTVKVPTRIVVNGEPTEIEYRMRPDPDAWRIVDITIDGVSTVENYRASFSRVMAKEGVDGLIRRLERGPAEAGT